MANTIEADDFAALAFRLGCSRATGVLDATVRGQAELLILRRGKLLSRTADVADASRRLERIAALAESRYRFEGGVSIYPPGARCRELCLLSWARAHIERQSTSSVLRAFATRLAGTRVHVGDRQLVGDVEWDNCDGVVLRALRRPIRVDQLSAKTRVPKFRLLTLLYTLSRVGALALSGVAADPRPPRRVLVAARRALGVHEGAGQADIKRAYRRLARALHPDLRESLPERDRRELEAKLVTINRAYRALV